MRYLHTPHDPQGEDDDGPCSNRPAPSRGQTFHSTRPYNPSSMPGASSLPKLHNPGGNLIGEQNISGQYHRYSNPAPVTGTQQRYGGQHPLSASSMLPSALSYSYNPHGTASTPHPPPHQSHLGGIQQGPLDAQGVRWRDVDPLPPEPKPDYSSYAQGEMPESRRTQGGSSMLRVNMPNPGYLNTYNAGQDNGSITYDAFGNAIGDVHSSKGNSSSQPEPLESPMMPFDANANAAMNMSNTAPPGHHWGPITGEPSQDTNATLQTPQVNPGYEPSGIPTYDIHTFGQPPEALMQAYRDHRPLQPRYPNVIDPQLPASRRARLRDSARSNVAPQLRRTRRKRSQSSSPPRRSRPRKGRILNTPSHYKRKRTAHVKRYNLACDRCKARKTECSHWDEDTFRSQYDADNAPNTPRSHATAPETRHAFRRPRPPASTRALAPSQRLETTQTSSSPTLLAYPGQTDGWEHTLAQNREQLGVPARLNSPLSAAAVLQGYPQHQDLANLDTMTHTFSEFTYGPVRPMQSPFTEGETPSQETAVMQAGTHFGPHTKSEQQFSTSNLLSELDEVNDPLQYPPIPNHDFTLLSPPENDWDPSRHPRPRSFQ